jgi:hypothetical protein
MITAFEYGRKESLPGRADEFRESSRIDGPADYHLSHGNPAISFGSVAYAPFETRGFPSPDYSKFGFFKRSYF